MMSNKRTRITTPKGIAKFPWLTKPDTRFSSDGVYHVQLLLKPDDPGVQEFLALLDRLGDEALNEIRQQLEESGKKAKAKSLQYRPPYQPDFDQEGEETGYISVRFKTRAKGKNREGKTFNRKPAIFDAKGNRIEGDIAIYGGSIIRVNFTPSSYHSAATNEAGVTLRLNAVQVIELVSRSDDAASFGFGVEDGYEYSPNQTQDDADDQDVSGTDGEEDF